jgi:hypothetical protein
VKENEMATTDSPLSAPSLAEIPKTRCERLLIVTRRLIVMTAFSLGIVAIVFGITLLTGKRFMVSWAAFGCGLIGGFVSIQQRIKNVNEEELELLSRSWFQILLIPVYGGIFALVLYLAFLGGIVEGALFPRFSIPPFNTPYPSSDDMRTLFTSTYPSTGTDFAKLIFWSFIAGFSERLVPQIISRTENKDS